MKDQKVEIILGRIFFSLISIILTFLLLDFFSQQFISSRSPIEKEFHFHIARTPKPYVMIGGKPYARGRNSLGYRGKVPLIPKDKDEFRIFILGGSTVYNGDPPIAVLLEENFGRKGFQAVQIFNFGVVSSVSSMELSRIVFEISELEPDLVVMYNGGNDIMCPFFWDPRPGYPYNFVVTENNPLLESEVSTYPSLALFAYGSNIFRSVFPSYFINKLIPSLEQLREQNQWQSDEWKTEIARIYVNNLVKANDISKVFGAEFIAFFQPMVYFQDPEKYFNTSEGAFAIDVRKKILSEIEKVRSNSSVKIIDLSGIYEGMPEQVFRDFIHTQQEYKTAVAREMYMKIVDSFDFPN